MNNLNVEKILEPTLPARSFLSCLPRNRPYGFPAPEACQPAYQGKITASAGPLPEALESRWTKSQGNGCHVHTGRRGGHLGRSVGG